MSKKEGVRLLEVPRLYRALYPSLGEQVPSDSLGLLSRLLKAETINQEGASHQGVATGERPHPFDMQACIDFQTYNEHHSTCVHTKVAAICGLGFVTDEERKMRKTMQTAMSEMGAPPAAGRVDNTTKLSKVDEVLNPLCAGTWQETLNDFIEDFVQAGVGYLEIVRADESSDTITGIHHIPAPQVHVYLEDAQYNKHYLIRNVESDVYTSPGSANLGNERRFAVFGDKEDFLRRSNENKNWQIPQDPRQVSEVIQLRRPTSKSKWYGFPDWLSAVASIELVQMLMQFNFDFFLNRGVPELLALFIGEKIDEDDWKKIENALMAQVGVGNTHKSVAANLVVNKENFEVKIEKLAMDESSTDDKFSKMRENLAAGIVSAHRVPPLLAGIQIPGKLGATNELPNALMAFQILVIGPYQRLLQQTLGSTLGNPEVNGGLALKMEDFELRKITEEIDIGQMDTVSRMRQSPAQASSEGRNLNAGVKK